MAERTAVFISKSRTVSENSEDIRNNYYDGAVVQIAVDGLGASSPSVVFTIQGKEVQSGNYYDILSSAAITLSGTTVLRVYPGATASTNVSVNDVLPGIWRVRAVHGNANPVRYAVSADML